MKLKPIYNDYTNGIIDDYIVYMEQNDLSSFINIESLDLPHFIGKIQHQQKEIERLNNIIKEVINIIQERIIEFDDQGFFEYPGIYDELLSILRSDIDGRNI